MRPRQGRRAGIKTSCIIDWAYEVYGVVFFGILALRQVSLIGGAGLMMEWWSETQHNRSTKQPEPNDIIPSIHDDYDQIMESSFDHHHDH